LDSKLQKATAGTVSDVQHNVTTWR